MNKFFILLTLLIFISNCSLRKVEKHHGVYNLKKKSDKLELFQTNTNDVIINFGIPSTKSLFDNDVWIYIERKFTSTKLSSFGKENLLVNNVLVLEFNTGGMLVKKELLDIDKMNNLIISDDETSVVNKKDTFVSNFLTSLIKKIDDPLGKKKAK
jgi:outer membrane protein assembly factor BamE (lipoprotein component of BamABCDE complex)